MPARQESTHNIHVIRPLGQLPRARLTLVRDTHHTAVACGLRYTDIANIGEPIMKFAYACALLAAGICADAAAQHKPEAVIHYRQSVMTLIGWNFAPMSAMVKGKMAWDVKEFALHAERISALAPMAPEGFSKGSDKGAETDAKPEIWAEPEDFQAKLNDLATESRALSDVAQGGDEAKAKEQFKKLAGACKNCHDKYKAD